MNENIQDPQSSAFVLASRLKLAFCLVLFATGATSALAEEETIGSGEYQNSCLSCHGVGGHGDGPMAEYLTVQPADLTTIAKRNDGVFPLQEIFQIIDGRSEVAAHGIRKTEAKAWEMPVWGDRYMDDAEEGFGPYGAEDVVQGRILALVFYLQSIQQ